MLKEECKQGTVDVSGKDQIITQLNIDVSNLNELRKQLEFERDVLQRAEKEGLQKIATNGEQCQMLVEEVATLKHKAEQADLLTRDLEIQRNNYAQILEKLTITLDQKQRLVEMIQQTMNTTRMESCQGALNIAQGIQAVECDEKAKRIIELETTLDNVNVMLEESEKQARNQQNEILQLQSEILKVSFIVIFNFLISFFWLFHIKLDTGHPTNQFEYQ